MEIQGEDGTKLSLKPGIKTPFGREAVSNIKDRKVSRRHLLLQVNNLNVTTQAEPTVLFEVIGKNPIWVRTQRNEQIQVYKKYEKSDLVSGDSLCVSSQNPVWFNLNRHEIETDAGESTDQDDDSGLDCLNLSEIDPAKEFGFLVIGKEFDQYPKERVPNIQNWDWFLEEPKKCSDEEEDASDVEEEVARKGKRKTRTKYRKKGVKGNMNHNDDDDIWTGESEDDEVIANVRKVQRPTYSTRSKDSKKSNRDVNNSISFTQRKGGVVKEEEEEDDETEEEDTLGGFIVGDEDIEVEEKSDLDDEEELDDDEDGDEEDDEEVDEEVDE